MRRQLSLVAIASALLSLSACGNMGELKPPPGESLPVKPMMARSTPTAEQLLTPPAFASPDRVDELMKKSAPRQSDRFDMPPPSGQAPTVPVEQLDEEQTNEVGPVTPQ